MGPLLMLGVIAVQNSDSLLEERHRRFPGSSGMPTPLPESTLPPVITTSTDEGGDEGSGDIDITTRTSMAEDLCVDLYAGGCHRGFFLSFITSPPCCIRIGPKCPQNYPYTLMQALLIFTLSLAPFILQYTPLSPSAIRSRIHPCNY